MVRRLLLAFVPLALACTLGLTSAHAAIYTWVDASGTVNISNLAPPEGVHVISVKQESPPKLAPHGDDTNDAARQLEVQALEDRVRQLEYEAEFARRPLPPVPTYQPVPAPQYVPQYTQYPDDYASSAGPGCDPSWGGCGSWGGPYGYPAAIVVLQSPNFRRVRPIRGGHNMAMQRLMQRPIQASGVAYRR